ncbi:MAG: MFS transporter [Candidatus Omnitrophica bacterium]|nr:MFS transporter [Candidatus Omnitrophota bacterium]
MEPNSRKKAFQVIILFGLVSLFGDIIYEGARSVNGPYLKTLGANAAVVGIIAGLGEFLGYAIRLISGYLSDRTKSYWFFVFIGYGMLVSVPLLSLSGVWQLAAFLIVAERIGKALRGPARDTIVSMATKHVGTGFGFGITEALDQIGAVTGPLIFTGLFLFGAAVEKGARDYQQGYGLLWIPFFILAACIFVAYRKAPRPQELEVQDGKNTASDKLSKLFWLYTAFSFLATAGFVNFLLLGYHFKARQVFSDAMIPFMYAVAMGVDALAALIIGKAYDILKRRRKSDTAGLNTLVIIPFLSILVVLCAFSGSFILAVTSMLLWGIVMGAHETIMKSAIADLTPLKKRGTGYGILNTSYGLAVLAGSALMGILYEDYLSLLIGGAVALQIAALALFWAMRKEAVKWQTA